MSEKEEVKKNDVKNRIEHDNKRNSCTQRRERERKKS